MEPSELFVDTLREQVRRLQSLIHDLEGHDTLAPGEYLYSQMTIQEVMVGLHELEQISSARGADRGLRAEWLN